MEKLQNPRLWFGTETNPYDPRSQSEQVGDNPMLAGKYGVKNLQMFPMLLVLQLQILELEKFWKVTSIGITM